MYLLFYSSVVECGEDKGEKKGKECQNPCNMPLFCMKVSILQEMKLRTVPSTKPYERHHLTEPILMVKTQEHFIFILIQYLEQFLQYTKHRQILIEHITNCCLVFSNEIVSPRFCRQIANKL